MKNHNKKYVYVPKDIIDIIMNYDETSFYDRNEFKKQNEEWKKMKSKEKTEIQFNLLKEFDFDNFDFSDGGVGEDECSFELINNSNIDDPKFICKMMIQREKITNIYIGFNKIRIRCDTQWSALCKLIDSVNISDEDMKVQLVEACVFEFTFLNNNIVIEIDTYEPDYEHAPYHSCVYNESHQCDINQKIDIFEFLLNLCNVWSYEPKEENARDEYESIGINNRSDELKHVKFDEVKIMKQIINKRQKHFFYLCMIFKYSDSLFLELPKEIIKEIISYIIPITISETLICISKEIDILKAEKEAKTKKIKIS
jgi:hypothetical protein